MSDFSNINEIYYGGSNNSGTGNPGGSVFNSYEQASGYINPIGEQAAILEAASERDKEWEIGKSLYNGLVVQGGRGILGTAKMANELWAEKAAANGYARNKDELMIGWNNLINSSPLQRYETGNNFANQLTEGAGQLIGQIGVGAATGGTGSMLYMGAQIAGNQYLDLTAEGVDTQRAATASAANALIQMPLERIGLGKILGGNANPLKRKLVDRLKDVGEAFVTEGFTEGLQELPEQLTSIWAKNPGITMQGVGAEWDKNAEQNLKAAGLSALIGGVLGFGGASARVSINAIGETHLQKAHESLQEELDNRLENNKKDGRTPEQITIETNLNLAGHEVAIEAAPLLEFMQTKNPVEVADALGVTVEDVQKAASDGLDVIIPQGNYEGTAAKYEGFRDSTREYMSFDEGDYSVNSFKQKRALAKEAKLAADEQEKLDIQLHTIAQEMADAGVPFQQRVGMLDVISRFAMREAEGLSTKDGHKMTAAQWLEQNPLEWKGDGKSGWFFKKGGMFRSKAKNWAEFEAEVNSIEKGERSKAGYFIDTNKGSEYIISGSAVGHIDGDKGAHPLTAEQWDGFNNNFENAEYAGYNEIKGNANKIDIYVKVPVNDGFVGAVFQMGARDDKRPVLVTAVYNNSKAIDNWLTKKGAARPLDISGGATSRDSRSTPVIPIIREQLDKVNPGWREIIKQSSNKNQNDFAQSANTVENGDVKGSFTPGGDGANIIRMFQGHDASTVIHETGHYFFEMFMQDSALDYASDRMKADRAAFLKYGETTEERWQYLHDGHKLSNEEFQELTKVHERVAEGFETYFIEGKPPARELRSLFRRFGSWLKSVYGIIKEGDWGDRNENAIELTDEVRAAFDHWLASEQEIEAVARIDGYFAAMPKVVTDNLSDKTKDRLAQFAEGARDKAIEIMVKKSMVNFTAERRAAIAQYKKDARPIVEAEIDEMPLYAAIAELRNVEGWKNANAKNIARKYTDSAAMVYTEYKDLKNRVDAGINDIVEPIIAQMEAGIDNSPKRTYWIDKETGQEVDVSDLERDNAEELKSGFQYQQYTEPDMSAPWFQRYKELYGKRISKKKIRELATEAALGHDPLGIFYEMTSGLNAEEQAQFKADMEAQAAELSAMLEIQKDMTVEGWSAKHYKDFALEPEQRVAFDTIAENAGYDSGDALARAILESPTRAQAINERIQEYVDERFPDIYKERAAAEQAAREAMYNDESAELLALEAQIVYEKALKMENNQEAAKGRAAKVAAVKAQVTLAAKAEISRMSLGDATQTKAFARAERRAAANAAKALKAGDYETAYAYKQQQMLNHAMARESMKIRQEMTKSVKFLRALRKWKPEKWGNEQHLGQAGMLMARMGINAKGYNPDMHSQPLAAYVQEMRAAYGDDVVDIADWLMDETVGLTNPRELTIEQYRDCINALKNLRQISMQDQVMHAFAKNMEVQQWKSEAVENLNKLEDKYKADPNGKQKPTWWEQYKASMRSTDNFFEMMDGWSNGFFSKTMATPLKHCADLERKMVLAMEKRAADAYVKWLADDAARNGAEEKHMYEELGCSVDKHTLVRMLANMGNDGNARVLCTTPPLGMENGSIWVRDDENATADEALAQTKENMIKFLGRVLTKEDIEYAQSLIDNANYYWNDLAQVERNTKGFAPVKVEAAPVLLTMADGSSVLFKGGYFPLVQNREGGYRPKGQDALNIDTENQSPPSAMFSTNQGSAKKRVNANYPIDMTRGCELRSMRDTIHDIAYRELMADFRNIFNDQEMYGLMLKKLGLADMRQLKEFLTVAANPYGNGTTALGESTFAATANWLRRKTVNAAIMLNLKTAFQNLGNITLYGNSVEGFSHQDAYNAVMKYGLQAASRTETDTDRLIAEKSVFMTERALAPDVTWKDAIEAMPAEWEQKLGLDKVEKGTLKWGAKLLAYTDNLTAKPVWRYAYEKKISQGATEQEAVDFADSIIRRTLGSNRAQDVSSMQRGSSLFRIFTTFQGFFNTQYSQWEREYNIAAKLASEGQRKEAMKRIVLFAASKWLLNCLICVTLGMENPFKKDKESDNLNKWGQECLSYPMSMLGPWGQGANMITNSLLGIRSYSYRMAAIQSTVDRYNKLARTTNNFVEGKATGKDMFENISSVALPLIGAPDQMHKLFWNGFDYFYGDISELEPADIVRRRPKSERK